MALVATVAAKLYITDRRELAALLLWPMPVMEYLMEAARAIHIYAIFQMPFASDFKWGSGTSKCGFRRFLEEGKKQHRGGGEKEGVQICVLH